MQELPLFEKFGFNAPIGSFLESGPQESVLKILSLEKNKFLKELSDNNGETTKIVNEINAMSDLTVEELERQRKEMDLLLNQYVKHNIQRKKKYKQGK